MFDQDARRGGGGQHFHQRLAGVLEHLIGRTGSPQGLAQAVEVAHLLEALVQTHSLLLRPLTLVHLSGQGFVGLEQLPVGLLEPSVPPDHAHGLPRHQRQGDSQRQP